MGCIQQAMVEKIHSPQTSYQTQRAVRLWIALCAAMTLRCPAVAILHHQDVAATRRASHLLAIKNRGVPSWSILQEHSFWFLRLLCSLESSSRIAVEGEHSFSASTVNPREDHVVMTSPESQQVAVRVVILRSDPNLQLDQSVPNPDHESSRMEFFRKSVKIFLLLIKGAWFDSDLQLLYHVRLVMDQRL